MNFESLTKNITDAVRESITKLGYEPLPLTLYYPREALCTLLEEDISADMMNMVLSMFSQKTKDTLQGVRFDSLKDGRYAVTVPAEGVRYVHEHTERADFTQSLVHLMEEPDCDIMEVASLFRANGDAAFIRSECEDFDYVLWFRNGEPDDYRYCFHNEMGRLIYHRFTPAEYEKLSAK